MYYIIPIKLCPRGANFNRLTCYHMSHSLIAPPVQERDAMPAEWCAIAGSQRVKISIALGVLVYALDDELVYAHTVHVHDFYFEVVPE